jgi:hypothetical protein
MSEAPERYKPREQWSVEEIVQHRRTGKAPESDEYRAYVREVHEEAGLEPPEGAAEPKPLDELTADEHFERIRGGGGR